LRYSALQISALFTVQSNPKISAGICCVQKRGSALSERTGWEKAQRCVDVLAFDNNREFADTSNRAVGYHNFQYPSTAQKNFTVTFSSLLLLFEGVSHG